MLPAECRIKLQQRANVLGDGAAAQFNLAKFHTTTALSKSSLQTTSGCNSCALVIIIVFVGV